MSLQKTKIKKKLIYNYFLKIRLGLARPAYIYTLSMRTGLGLDMKLAGRVNPARPVKVSGLG